MIGRVHDGFLFFDQKLQRLAHLYALQLHSDSSQIPLAKVQNASQEFSEATPAVPPTAARTLQFFRHVATA